MSGERTNGWETAREWGFLTLRAALGVIFMAHGAQKLFGWFGGHGFAATVAAFEAGLGIPAPLAALAILTEFFGGLAVLLGVFTRTAALGLAVTMVVAAAKVHWANGFFMNWENAPGHGHGIETNLALGVMALFLALAGPGRWALAGDTEWRLIEGRRQSGLEADDESAALAGSPRSSVGAA
jgi:putative oxidoreductase